MYNMPNARVAVIDDDRMVREMLELGLSREGYEVRTAMDGMAALELVKVFDPELIVLDIMMPKIDGVTLLPRLREITQAPIVMLTAKGGTEDKVRSLSSGADDYLVKPFVFEELIARLQAKLRRPQLIEENVLRWHDVSINPGTREAWRAKEVLEFTQREFDLLEVFLREPRRVFSKDHLLEIVWGHDFEGGPNIVETYISYLRAKIDRPREPGSFIRTVRGVGYGLSL
jgi:DNA-binding response OmpR family regulator